MLSLVLLVFLGIPCNIPKLPPIETVQESSLRLQVNDEEFELMARVVMSESSILIFESKILVAETIINRSIIKNKSIKEIILEPSQFSLQDNGEVSDECRRAVKVALSKKHFEEDIYYFCSDGYNQYGTPLIEVGGMFYSFKEKETYE